MAIYLPRYNKRGVLEAEDLVMRRYRLRPGDRHAYPRDSGAYATTPKAKKNIWSLATVPITRYDYDEKTFRLRQLRTTRPTYSPSFPQFRSNLADANVLQQLLYTYDPVGNITEIEDQAYKPVFFANGIAEPKSQYEYDALYRLIYASGRETAQGGDALKESRETVGANGFPDHRSDTASLYTKLRIRQRWQFPHHAPWRAIRYHQKLDARLMPLRQTATAY